jgi:RimJ/RimL family protein N-acetyltransferase
MRMGSERSTESALVEADDADFEWMLAGNHEHHRGLTLPPGGVDDSVVLQVVRGIAQRLRAANSRGSWMIVSGREIVGLCGYRRPSADGEVEIGYSVAASRRGRGHATRAVAAIVAAASLDASMRALVAETSVANAASRLVLERNAFIRMGTRIDPQDGEVLTWRKRLTA